MAASVELDCSTAETNSEDGKLWTEWTNECGSAGVMMVGVGLSETHPLADRL
jgi:hypothetical protein